MRATVVTIRTVIQPGNKTVDHTIVIANGRARSGDELDRWRLFDLDHDRVTFVDDISRTFRTESFDSLAGSRRAKLNAPLPELIPRAQFVVTHATKPILGVTTTQSFVRLGGYVRELWIGQHPSIPPHLFAMMAASRPPSSPIDPAMKAVDAALMEVKGFPLAEHAELTYGNKKMVVDKSVVSVEQRDVPVGWLSVGKGYQDTGAPVTPSPSASLKAGYARGLGGGAAR